MGVSKQQEEMVLPAGPVLTGPAGFSALYPLKRVFGPEQVEAAVEADKQREQAEKGRKRPRRSLDRSGRWLQKNLIELLTNA